MVMSKKAKNNAAIKATVKRASPSEENSIGGRFHQAKVTIANLGNKIINNRVVVWGSVRTYSNMSNLHIRIISVGSGINSTSNRTSQRPANYC